MKRILFMSLMIVSLLSITGSVFADNAPKYPHKDLIDSYDGTETCLACHEDEAKNFIHSVHYQWMGSTQNVANVNGKQLGKANTINEFGTNAMINWIGIAKNSKGQVIGQGCSQCHAGLGKKPENKVDDAELNNIDCLVCHAPGYKRHVVKENGKFKWKPIGTPEQLTAMAQKVGMPTRENCLSCHANAGGGPNLKRGDLEPTLLNAPKNFDVHMSPKGMNMQCTDCHWGKDHKLGGGGADNPAVDITDRQLSCEGCHTTAPHRSPLLNKHVRTVACETCHIPSFAKQSPTDMFRDWSKSMYLKKYDKHIPGITFKKNVKPVYAWWNGKTWFQDANKPIKIGKNNKFVISKPLGNIKDVHAKIYPFKYHEAKYPYDPATMKMIPVNIGMLFMTGQWKKAIISGAKAFYGKAIENFKFAVSQRWMGIYHEVVPKAKALRCQDCHTAGKGRIDWKAMGYPGDPMKTAMDRFKLFKIKPIE